MTTEQRSGFRLPWSGDRAAASTGTDGAREVAAENASTDDVRGASGGAVAGATDDVSAPEGGSWVMAGTGWAAEPPGEFEEGGDVGGGAEAEGGDAGADAPAAIDARDAVVAAWPQADMATLNGNGRGGHDAPSASDGSPANEPPNESTREPADDGVAARAPDPQPGAERRTSSSAAAATNGNGSRPTRFLAEMTRAMQAAAQTARDESLARLAAEAKEKVDQIQEQGTTGTAELRRRADDDVAATREWSKAEIARIREETEQRIAERKSQLEVDVERHVASIKRRAELVRDVVARHEAELAAFIDRLMAEDDPARIATLAQELPEPPLLDEIDASLTETASGSDDDARGEVAIATSEPAPTSIRHRERGPRGATSVERLAAGDAGAADDDATDDDAAVEADAGTAGADEASSEPVAEAEPMNDAEPEAAPSKPERGGPKLSAAGAAAAEAEALAGLDDGDDHAAVRVDRRAVPAGGAGRTEVLVSGLASVPGIAGFKRELSRLPGVRSVGVSAGEAGQFVFAVSHDPGTDLANGIPTITAFEAQLSGRRTGTLLVKASEPAAAE
jgi:hypothetical protein